jgi:streptomycin 3"-adenylyltransferase
MGAPACSPGSATVPGPIRRRLAAPARQISENGSVPEALRYEHPPGRPQGWVTADEDLRSFVDAVTAAVAAELEPAGCVGAYLHGSLAMGSLYRPKSDLDLLFVVDERLSPGRRRAVAQTVCRRSDERPIVGDLEVSVLRRADTLGFHEPLPFEVHYSERWKEAIRAGAVDYTVDRTDPDLAVHCTAVRARGLCLGGAPIADVFGPVPVEAHRAAILDDLTWILAGDHIVESPLYGVLNCCRVLALDACHGWDQVLSKDEGAEWALANLPEAFRPTVAQALACYRSPEPVPRDRRETDGHDWDAPPLLQFRDHVRGVVASW